MPYEARWMTGCRAPSLGSSLHADHQASTQETPATSAIQQGDGLLSLICFSCFYSVLITRDL